MKDIKYIIIRPRVFESKINKIILGRMFESSNIEGADVLIMKKKSAYIPPQEIYSYFDSNEIYEINMDQFDEKTDIKIIYKFINEINKDITFQEYIDKINFGKKLLYLAPRSSKYISRFHKSPECPGFLQGVFIRGCRNNCKYCFLRLTMRIRPITSLYCDFEQIVHEFKQLRSQNNREIVNCSESGGIGSILNMFPEYWNEIQRLAGLYHQTLLFTTKTNNIYNIPKSDKRTKNNIYAWSINTPEGIQELELSTASYKERIKAMKHMRSIGYRVAARFDPIFVKDLYHSFFIKGEICKFRDLNLKSVFKVLDDLIENEIEYLVLGTYRGYPNLNNFIELSFPDNWKKIFDLEEIPYEDRKHPTRRVKYPIKIRSLLYKTIYKYVKDEIPNVRLCKEPLIRGIGYGRCLCKASINKTKQN
ncbi:MAG: hypothetical protein GF317_05915 [Candidatus Lokiarchaeota archaeon]|nr:hypothetical protein [Candidatus Lokiarchaeota archaeon]